MINFNLGDYFAKLMPKNLATKASSYTIGTVPVATIGFIGATAALIGVAHSIDPGDDTVQDSQEDETKEDQPPKEDGDTNPVENGDLPKEEGNGQEQQPSEENKTGENKGLFGFMSNTNEKEENKEETNKGDNNKPMNPENQTENENTEMPKEQQPTQIGKERDFMEGGGSITSNYRRRRSKKKRRRRKSKRKTKGRRKRIY
jgi:hypothetical protein